MRGDAGARGPNEAAPWIILGVLAGAVGLQSIVWLGGNLGALSSGAGWKSPSFGVATVFTVFRDGPGALWPDVGLGWIWAGIILSALLHLGPVLVGWIWAWRRWSGPPGLARISDLQSLAPKQIAKRARRLRPSLADVDKINPDDAGILLGVHQRSRTPLRASLEDVTLAIMAPRSGKSTALAIPAVLRAPGAVMLTSNKADVYAVTRSARAKVGRIWGLDPQGIAHARQDMWWDMLEEATTLEGARRLAGHFVATSVDAGNRKDFWFSAATNTLCALFHAAARGGRTVSDVLNWLALPADQTPIELLDQVGMVALSKQLEGTIQGAPETRDGIYETARQCVACLLDPAIAAWVTPTPGKRQFVPRKFVTTRDTLYLLSKDGGASAAGVIAAATDAVLRAAVAEAEMQGGRIDPPVLAMLDEAANICRIEDLPTLYSHLGSRGVLAFTILQSYRQGVTVWGEAGMDSLWSAATCKVLGAGLDDADFVEKVSRLVGDHKMPEVTRSYSYSGSSTSVTHRLQRTMQASDIRALPKGWSLLLATGIRPALLVLDPWYESARAAELGKALQEETEAITKRAIAAHGRMTTGRPTSPPDAEPDIDASAAS